jgi:hypothetical protein
MVMSAWRHRRNGLVVIIRAITGVAPLLLSLKLLLPSSCYPSNDLVLLELQTLACQDDGVAN